MLYGVAPSPTLARVAALRPVMTLRTVVVAIRDVQPGDSVGYGASWRAARATRIATLPAGYADGVPRIAGGRGQVLVGGERRPIVGRVSMDYITVDVGGAAVRVGDEAILFGPGLPVEEAALAAQTIGYELLVRVGGRVPRRLVAASEGAARPD
jgi:alanine racemase